MRPIHSTVILILAACFCAATLHAADTPADANRLAAINNHAVWKDGRPVALPKVSRPAVEGVMLFEPKETDWKYSHHQSITAFKGQLFAIWSSSQRDEDSPGQRVMYAYRNEKGWIQPRILFQPDIEPDGRLRILTAAGFYQHNGTLVAYAGDYSIDRKSTRLLARTSTDGRRWSEVRDLHVPVCPNHGPQATATGRLIIAGNTAFPYTDDPAGLTGWRMTGVFPSSMTKFQDNPSTFWDLAKQMKWRGNVCEASLHQTDDKTLHMLLRAANIGLPGPNKELWSLWETSSTDNGETWSAPRPTDFSNTDAKFHFGRLPDGRFYCVNNPIGVDRIPLVLSTSRDGINFGRHFILGEQRYVRRFEGGSKGGHYGYPHTLVFEGDLYVIVSRQKESVEVLRVALTDLRDDHTL